MHVENIKEFGLPTFLFNSELQTTFTYSVTKYFFATETG